jgi:major membrane immunogen (membrane-anchored lipoprotein)
MNQFMNSALKKWQPFAIAISLSAMVTIAGCGDDGSGLGRRYAVKGKVTYKGAPVAHGTVNFLPTDPPPPEGRAATGEITDGYYSLTTVGDFDGALPGKYMVAIVALDVDLASAASSKAEGGQIHQGDAAHRKAMKNAKSLIPSKYGTGETSKLVATVETSSKTVDFDLTD